MATSAAAQDGLVDELVTMMQVSRKQAVDALRRSHNNLEAAVDYLLSQPKLQEDDQLASLAEIFPDTPPSVLREALRTAGMDMQRAVNALTERLSTEAAAPPPKRPRTAEPLPAGAASNNLIGDWLAAAAATPQRALPPASPAASIYQRALAAATAALTPLRAQPAPAAAPAAAAATPQLERSPSQRPVAAATPQRAQPPPDGAVATPQRATSQSQPATPLSPTSPALSRRSSFAPDQEIAVRQNSTSTSSDAASSPDWLLKLYKQVEKKSLALPSIDPALLPPGFTRLLPYQRQALEWMMRRESGPPMVRAGTTNPSLERWGGINACDMGLGKTIMTLALMRQQGCRNPLGTGAGTLVISNMSLLDQWQDEIKRWCPTFRVLMLHGKACIAEEMVAYDVVLTTPQTWRSRCNKIENVRSLPWHRVVIDEATSVTGTHPSDVRGRSVWLLTGSYPAPTVLRSMLEMLYGSGTNLAIAEHQLSPNTEVRCERCTTAERASGSAGGLLKKLPWAEGHAPRVLCTRCRRPATHSVLAHAVPKELWAQLTPALMVRFTKAQSHADGRSVISLPKITLGRVLVPMTPEETRVYRGMWDKFVHVGTHVQTMANLMQLRQYCSYPRAIGQASVQKALDEPELPERFRGGGAAAAAAAGAGAAGAAGEERVQGMLTVVVDTLIESADEHRQTTGSELVARLSQCPVCFEELLLKPTDNRRLPILTGCGHTFCLACVDKWLKRAETQKCPMCNGGLSREAFTVIVPGSAPEIPALEVDAITSETLGDAYKALPDPGSKATAILEAVLALREAEPSAKVLIFTQFPATLARLRLLLQSNGVRCLVIDGAASRSARAKQVAHFQDPETGACAFLLTFTSAAVGLNLTAAHHIFIADISSNSATLAQALNRCHRIGQTCELSVRCFVAPDTIEAYLYDLQRAFLQGGDSQGRATASWNQRDVQALIEACSAAR